MMCTEEASIEQFTEIPFDEVKKKKATNLCLSHNINFWLVHEFHLQIFEAHECGVEMPLVSMASALKVKESESLENWSEFVQ